MLGSKCTSQFQGSTKTLLMLVVNRNITVNLVSKLDNNPILKKKGKLGPERAKILVPC